MKKVAFFYVYDMIEVEEISSKSVRMNACLKKIELISFLSLAKALDLNNFIFYDIYIGFCVGFIGH